MDDAADRTAIPAEAEGLLLDLMGCESLISKARDRLESREVEIAEPLCQELARKPDAEHTDAAFDAAAKKLADLRRTKYRSELASLAADVVREERRRERIRRKLDAFPQLGEVPPPIDLAVEYDGERDFIVRTGGGRVFRFTLPVMLDRGLWRADGRYQRGDCVTSDGSLWIARQNDPAHEPGKGDGWRLAVMRGRNGRDAKPSANGVHR